jgi:hypothetical protein
MWYRPLLLCLLLAGCHAILPFTGRDVRRTDLGPVGDGPPPTDRRVEGLDPSDGPATEGPRDSGPAGDAALLNDTGVGGDVAAIDSLADGPPVTGGCKNNQLMLYSSGTMAACQLSPPRNHCTAHQACAGGWHLCAMSEFLMHGGKTEAPPEKAWLQGCLPQGSSGFAIPMDGFCSCNPGFGSSCAATWPCAGSAAASTSSSLLALGILADTEQQTLGTVQNPTYCAYWTADMPSKAFGAALCCQ